MLGGVEGGPCVAAGGFDALLFFLGLLGDPGEPPPPPGLKSPVRLEVLDTEKIKVNIKSINNIKLFQIILV